MELQPLFRRFDEKIKLYRHQQGRELTRRGEVILEHLRNNIGVKHKFQHAWQGSYAMGTGVQPVNGDYDIDIAIEFNVCCDDHRPTVVKGWVFDALKSLGPAEQLEPEVKWRGPCITVYYRTGKEIKYHVDLAVMAKDRNGRDVRLARGKANAAPTDQLWENDDRRSFIEAVEKRFPGVEGEQFRRVIRYLKRWKDEKFPRDGVSAPSGFALTVAALQWFRPIRTGSAQNPQDDDLAATSKLVETIRSNFGRRWDATTRRDMHRLNLPFQYAPHDDTMKKMSDDQHQQAYQRLEKLSALLTAAGSTGKSDSLRQAFGNDFPER